MDKLEKIKNIKSKPPFKILDIFLVLILLAASVCLIVFMPQKKGAYVEVYVDGKLVLERPLNIDYEQIIYTNNGEHYNTIKIEGGYVFVIDADCDDKTCVNMGKTNSPAKPIICLPHHLKIIVVSSEPGVDVIV